MNRNAVASTSNLSLVSSTGTTTNNNKNRMNNDNNSTTTSFYDSNTSGNKPIGFKPGKYSK